jgi:hypothetical protein
MLKKIRLELARTPDHPAGRKDQGFVVIAPLTPAGHLDAKDWSQHKAECRVTQFEGSAEHHHGLLQYAPAHHGGLPSWFVTFEDETTAKGFRFETERFVPGEYVSLAVDGRTALPYTVITVTPADQPSPHRTHL